MKTIKMLSKILLMSSLFACTFVSSEEQSQDLKWPVVIDYSVPRTKSLAIESKFELKAIRTVANQVADWQLSQYDIKSNKMRTEYRASGLPQGWMYAPLHSGLLAWSAATEQDSYKQAVYNIAMVNQWRLGPRKYHADDHAIGQAYLDLYQEYGDTKMMENVKSVLDWVAKNPSKRSFDFEAEEKESILTANREYIDPWCTQRWCWADAIFMSPPVWAQLSAITGDNKYFAFMNEEFWATTKYLYSEEDKLYLRDSRYFTKKASNGKPIYWGRGNGWVLAGIARTLKHIPEGNEFKPKYVELFRDISYRLKELQKSDGSWPSSLLDDATKQNPESSGTGLIAFALMWGVNNGILEKEVFLPTIKAAWSSLASCVHSDGKLGFVQQVAFAPGSATVDDTQLYGTGALLLAAAEITEYLKQQ